MDWSLRGMEMNKLVRAEVVLVFTKIKVIQSKEVR